MKKFLSIAFLVLVIGCGGKTQYEDVNKAEGSME